jgi:hypothetical protein
MQRRCGCACLAVQLPWFGTSLNSTAAIGKKRPIDFLGCLPTSGRCNGLTCRCSSSRLGFSPMVFGGVAGGLSEIALVPSADNARTNLHVQQRDLALRTGWQE